MGKKKVAKGNNAIQRDNSIKRGRPTKANQVPQAKEDTSAPAQLYPRYKDDLSSFNVPVEDDRDFISGLPSETLDQILSYLTLDHESDRFTNMQAQGTKYVERPHVLLSMAAMSKRFHALVESFSVRHMAQYKDYYRFQTTAEEAEAKRNKPSRRSARLSELPQVDSRIYRKELVDHVQTHCIKCGYWTSRRQTLCNGVACCSRCEDEVQGPTITLTDALQQFDLRDWMLIKSRKPGPRAKHTDLPALPYGTVRTGLGWGLGMCTSYRFRRRDVKTIARLVHGDVDAHMAKKRQAQTDRKNKKLRALHIELKIRQYTDRLAHAEFPGEEALFRKRLAQIQDPDWDGKWAPSIRSMSGYGNYDDVHERICAIDPCAYCEEDRAFRYCSWY